MIYTIYVIFKRLLVLVRYNMRMDDQMVISNVFTLLDENYVGKDGHNYKKTEEQNMEDGKKALKRLAKYPHLLVDYMKEYRGPLVFFGDESSLIRYLDMIYIMNHIVYKKQGLGIERNERPWRDVVCDALSAYMKQQKETEDEMNIQ